MTAAAWPEVRLDSVAEVRLGRQRSPKHHTGNQMRPYVRAANVGWDGLQLDDVKTMNFTDAEMAVYALQPGDLLLGEASGSATEVGKPAIWAGELESCAFQNTLLRVRPLGPDPRYLLHYFRFQAESGGFARRSRGVGIYHLGREALASLDVPLPPIEEQRRIAAVLDQADALRAKRREALALLDAVIESIFLETLTADTAVEHRPLGEIGAVQGGLQVTRSRAGNPVEAPYLRVANVYRGYLDLTEIKMIEVTDTELERTRLHVDDLLIVEGHGNPAEIGRVARWDGSIDSCVHQNHLIRVRVDTSVAEPIYVEAFLNSHHGRRSLLRSANTTSGLNTISTGDVKAVIVDLPPRPLQAQFATRVAAVAEERRRLERSAERLDELFASLQHRAFRGEL